MTTIDKKIDKVLGIDNVVHDGLPFKRILAGAGMSRVISHIKSGVPFMFISAFRNQYSLNDNRKRNTSLLNDIRAYGLGAIRTEGWWKEEGTEKETKEESFFVNAKTDNDEILSKETFFDLVKNLCSKYDQDAILWGDGEKIYLYFGSGDNEVMKGDYKVDYSTIPEIYTRVEKEKGSNRKLVMSSLIPSINNSNSALAFKKKGYKLLN